MLDIKYELTKSPKAKPAADDPLRFGTIFTDHMFVMNYETGERPSRKGRGPFGCF